MRVKKSSIYVALEVFRNSCRMVSCSWRNLTKGSFLLHIVTMSAVEITSSYVALCEKCMRLSFILQMEKQFHLIQVAIVIEGGSLSWFLCLFVSFFLLFVFSLVGF